MAFYTMPVPSAGIHSTLPQVELFVNETSLGKGTLVVAESRLAFDAASGKTFSLDYKSVCLHAIASPRGSFPKSLYLLMKYDVLEDFEGILEDKAASEKGDDDEADDNEGVDDVEEADDDDPEDEKLTEIRVVPAEESALEPLFDGISECMALHRDADDEDDDSTEDEEEDGAEDEGEFGDVSAEVHLISEYAEEAFPTDDKITKKGWLTLRRLEAMLGANCLVDEGKDL